ncbi:MAG: DUF1959 domain-containing protein [Euryarchaeota archaeon]|nr:DUF1959 domain-containing protein [Euryarchaeota archaeon]
MTKYLYEKDLRKMKLNILVSPLHDRLVRTVADLYNISRQEMRKQLMEKCDMILLENLPTRYDDWIKNADEGSLVQEAVGYNLMTKYIPIINKSDMNEVLMEIQARISEGMQEELAVTEGKIMIRELILR